MWQSLIVVSLLALATSCNKNYQQTQVSKFYEDGIAKPVLALGPILDTSSCDVPWSLSEELSQLFLDRLAKRESLYLSRQGAENLSSSENPFGNDLTWTKKEFSSNEFVVFLELVEHEIIPASKTHTFESASNLNLGLRIRIVDLRGSQPKIVLQELIRETHVIDRSFLPFDYNQMPWGTKEYTESPLSNAHNSIVKTISDRINDYIVLAKSRWHG